MDNDQRSRPPNRSRSGGRQSQSHHGRGRSINREGKTWRPVVENPKEDESSSEPLNGVSLESKPLNSSDQAHEASPTSSSLVEKNETLRCDLSPKNPVENLSPFSHGNMSSGASPMSGPKTPMSIGKDENSGQSEVFDIFKPKKGAYQLNRGLLDINRERRKTGEAPPCKVLKPGMVLLKGFIPIREQVQIAKRCRDLGIGPGGFYRPGYKDGAKLHLTMMCLGKNWDPETGNYGDHRPSDGSKPPNIPVEFYQLVERAIRESHSAIKAERNADEATKLLPLMKPDICLANFYTTTGRLGLHQDRDESQESIRRGLPVVSFSIGDDAEFSYSDRRDVEGAEEVVLQSGDALVFGGPSRSIFHGVTAIRPTTAPKALIEQTNLRPGRLNLTFRQY